MSAAKAGPKGSAAKQPKPGQKLRGQNTSDIVYLKTLADMGGWVGAVEVAKAHGHSWYAVAYALRRLVESGRAEEDVVEVVGAKRPREHTRVYRVRVQPGEVRRIDTLLPGWLCPQVLVDVGIPRKIAGKASLSGRWVDKEKKKA